MAENNKQDHLQEIKKKFTGEILSDEISRLIYATDASSYRQVPLAVAFPKSVADIQLLVEFADENNISLIPRTAGTSLAGQVVGDGLIVDVSRYFNKILEYNDQEKWVRLQPGVIRDDLNRYLRPFGVFFAPETSTANRAMIGGMVGNNSCGSNSVIYSSTREHLLSLKTVLADGSEVEFADLSTEDFERKCQLESFEGKLYSHIRQLLADDSVRENIASHYPDPKIPRRNTGYALDVLMNADPFEANNLPFNFCKLLAGSEGTLAFTTEVKLAVTPLPPSRQGLICAHFDNIHDSLVAAQKAIKYGPSAVELMDHYILDATRNHNTYRHNMFFVEGEPKAILVVELRAAEDDMIQQIAEKLIAELQEAGLGYHHPIVWNKQAKVVWELRKAGLGLLSNMPGDAKPVPVVEDTAVSIDDLPNYIDDFNSLLKRYDLNAVHYAHAGSGELHLRPILDLKTLEGNITFRDVAEDVSKLVKKYNGSLSGEHGDGRLRGEFIPFMIGEENYQHLVDLKKVWDPKNIFNKGKIVATPSMNTQLRFDPGQHTPEYDTVLDFSSTFGIVRAAEQCNGSADCRKSAEAGGVMCPSYMATKDERLTTRARANIFREIAGRGNDDDPFLSEEIKEILDLCLSCKGCKSECPSNVDIAKIKTEFLHQHQELTGVPFRTKLIGNYAKTNARLAKIPGLYNGFIAVGWLSYLFKKAVGFAPQRSMPKLNKQTFIEWFKDNKQDNFGVRQTALDKKVLLFADEFTNYNDLAAGQAVVKVLAHLGYDVELSDNVESGRSYISKGMLNEAKELVNENVGRLKDQVLGELPVVGIEPSAILSFRDEYIDLAEDKESAKNLARNTFLFEEFIENELAAGRIDKSLFKPVAKTIKYHGHCHQKALSSMTPLHTTLGLIPEAKIEQIPSGCCGMAGSFGYEKEHYDLSMEIGELVLFPAVRDLPEGAILVAPGTSCRHQIKDGTKAKSYHPAEVLWESLK
jgi:FAD/FMN-containing dehydrogenase/Fe-S oxidoreductase